MEAKIMLPNKIHAKDSETLIPMAMAIDDGDIDVENQQLYSRQIREIGTHSMNRLRGARVLISGMGSLGVEVAKNLILAGVSEVVIHETKTVKMNDLSAQFYLIESDIGRNRADASFASLISLNPTVKCSLSTKSLDEHFVASFDLIVLTDAPFLEQVQINEWTRSYGKQFISADARGLFSYLFVDLGENFIVKDPDGLPCNKIHIKTIDLDSGDVITFENIYLEGFKDGDFVRITGIPDLSDEMGPVQISVKDHETFNVGDALRQFARNQKKGNIISGGRCRKVKIPTVLSSFKPLSEALENPTFLAWDLAKFSQCQQLHTIWRALYSFEKKYGRSPSSNNESDTKLLADEIKNNVEISSELLKQFSSQATGNLQPIASFTGGIAAQEAIKAITQRTMPIVQFLYTESLEALPKNIDGSDDADDHAPRNCRYDGQAAVFGWKFQQKLAQTSWLITGAGAIGCELLKNFAMMGISCSEDGGKLHLADMDQIELSNLNRQFLFRNSDIGKNKSEVASNAAKRFNPEINVVPYMERVASDTEHIFTQKFFSMLDGAINAVDNVPARLYIDERCIHHKKPILDSGTDGSWGSTQIIYPNLTQSYRSTANLTPKEATPSCTLRHYPYLITHTIQWAREKFGDCFTFASEVSNEFLSNYEKFSERLEEMNAAEKDDLWKTINQLLVVDRVQTFDDCVIWARRVFDDWFNSAIVKLLQDHPPNSLTETGTPFWTGTKYCPHPIDFDVSKSNHLDFVVSASLLRAQQYQIDLPFPDKLHELRAYVARLVTTYNGRQIEQAGPIIFGAQTNGEVKKIAASLHEIANTVSAGPDTSFGHEQLRASLKIDSLRQIDFDKDDDLNHHVKFVMAAANLRAEIYGIERASFIKTKEIAGQIGPALATTTAVAAGLISLELYKVVDCLFGEKQCSTDAEIARFKNGFFNLAIPRFTFVKPSEASHQKSINGKSFTLWDSLDFNGPLTLEGLIAEIENETNSKLILLSSEGKLLYAFYDLETFKQNKNMQVEDVFASMTNHSAIAGKYFLILEATCRGAISSDEELEVPFIKYFLPLAE